MWSDRGDCRVTKMEAEKPPETKTVRKSSRRSQASETNEVHKTKVAGVMRSTKRWAKVVDLICVTSLI